MRLIRRRGSRVAAALAFVLLLAVAGCGGGDEEGSGGTQGGSEQTQTGGEATGEPIKIAMVTPLTGPYTALGTDNREAVQAAVKYYNANGGVNGRPISVDVKDDGTEPERTVLLTRQVVDDDSYVAMLGTSFSSAAFAAEPIASEAGIPYVSLAGSRKQVDPIAPFVYMTPPTSLVVADALGEYLQQQGMKNVALLRDNGGYPTEGAADVKSVAPKYGLNITDDIVFGLEAQEFSANLTKIKNSNADAIWLWNVTPQSVTITKEIQSLNVPQQLVLTHGNATPFYLDPACPAADGAIIASSFAQVADQLPEDNPSREIALTANEELKSAGVDAPSQFHYDGWTGVQILVEAMRQVQGDLTRDAINDAIESSTVNGPEGVYRFGTDNHGGPGRENVVVETIEDCQLTPAEGQNLAGQ